MKLKIAKILKFEEKSGTCEHCGADLKYIVTVQLENGDSMRIGRDCALKGYLVTPDVRKMLRKTPAQYRADRICDLKIRINFLRKSLSEYDKTVEMFGANYVLLDKDGHNMQLECVYQCESELEELLNR